MHDVIFNKHLKSFQELCEVLESLFLGEFAFRLYLFLQSALITELVNKIVIISSFKDFYEPYDVCRIFDFRESVDFVDCELLEFGAGAEFFYLDDFDGNCLTCFFIIGFVDFPELSCADGSFEDVVFDFFSHSVWFDIVYWLDSSCFC